jgi:hypothetical protein
VGSLDLLYWYTGRVALGRQPTTSFRMFTTYDESFLVSEPKSSISRPRHWDLNMIKIHQFNEAGNKFSSKAESSLAPVNGDEYMGSAEVDNISEKR